MTSLAAALENYYMRVYTISVCKSCRDRYIRPRRFMLLIADWHWAVSYENLKTKEKSIHWFITKAVAVPGKCFSLQSIYRSNSLNGVFPEKLVVTWADHMQQESEPKERAFEYCSLLTANSSFILFVNVCFQLNWNPKWFIINNNGTNINIRNLDNISDLKLLYRLSYSKNILIKVLLE